MNRNDQDIHTPHPMEGPRMIAAMRDGVLAALEDHKRSGRPVVVWDRESGQVVTIPAVEITIPDALEDDPFESVN